MAATDHLGSQFPKAGNEAIDVYARHPSAAAIQGNPPGSPGSKYPKIGNEALDKEYQQANGR